MLPYNPTTIFPLSTSNNTVLYIIQQTSSTSLDPKLVALNTSGTLSAATLPITTISQTLPFTANIGTSYTTIQDSLGGIYAYAGQCGDGSEGATLWTFTPGTEGIDGTWLEQRTTTGENLVSGQSAGANSLAAGFSYASTVNGSSDIYVFGGMCPNTTASDAQHWQGSADYSDTMLTFQPVSSSAAESSTQFTLGEISSQGPPIPEAGFTVTPLEPAVFTSSDGNTSQQQSFVLLGGHTQNAFINMSQVALFSLPQQSWAFLPVDSPSTTAKTDLAVRETGDVDPRSGHTAILTPNGKQIVVFGGWVGDVTNPANPQLAILELGEGYGGTSDWQWSIPGQDGPTLPNGSGLYGHGAAMLPGGVMIITGGYSIPASNGDSSKRSDSSLSPMTYFFNVSSSTWISTYTNPQSVISPIVTSDQSPGTSIAVKAGLGAGLGLGVAVLIAVLVMIFCYRRRVKSRKAAREKELRELALGAQRFHSSGLGLGGFDGRGGEVAAVNWMDRNDLTAVHSKPWMGNNSNIENSSGVPGRRSTRSPEAERTGLLVEIPSPTRGLRRSLHSRSAYQPPAWYDEGRRSRGSGHIHPIDERDEYEDAVAPAATAPEMSQRPCSIDLLSTTMPSLDPFLDPLGSHPVNGSRSPSPQSPAHDREREVAGWIEDWDAAAHLQAGRVSPDKTDRTSSTLSERSAHSVVSALSARDSVGDVGRSASQRSSWNPFSSNHSTALPSPVSEHPPDTNNVALARHASQRRSQSLTIVASRQHQHQRPGTADSFITAASSFAQLQAEGQTLLGHSGSRYPGANSGDISPVMRSPVRARGWMGNMRRALSGAGGIGGVRARRNSASAWVAHHSSSASPDSGHTASSSPTKLHPSGPDTGLPRRAASTGTMLWRKRQGARDWDVGGYSNSADLDRPSSSAGVNRASWTGGTGVLGKRGSGIGAVSQDEEGEEEWDVESAVERRVVQVMFTVPKEKLRVVNAGPDGDGISIASVGGERERERGADGVGGEKGKGKEKLADT
ncbi:hypothetical protein MMC19_004768 [Ptychographa xylographoides]|nr:hypothetical protein [Ptychographa xylographoides]